jgi:non-ribosomal peptide synthetase component F
MPSPLPELDIQYVDFAVWERALLQGAELEEQMAYWRRQLAGVPTVELPFDRPRPAVKGHRGASIRFDLGQSLTKRLQELGQQEDATLFMIMMAAFQMVLGKYAAQQDVAVGAVIANRNSLETERLIGFFVNTLVIRSRLDPDLTFRKLLHQVRHATLNAYQRSNVPFDKIVEQLQPDRDLSRTPLFQAMLIFQNLPQARTLGSGLVAEMLPSANTSVRSDIDLYITATQGALSGTLVYDLELFDMPTVRLMLEEYQYLLKSIANQLDISLLELMFVQEHSVLELL